MEFVFDSVKQENPVDSLSTRPDIIDFDFSEGTVYSSIGFFVVLFLVPLLSDCKYSCWGLTVGDSRCSCRMLLLDWTGIEMLHAVFCTRIANLHYCTQ